MYLCNDLQGGSNGAHYPLQERLKGPLGQTQGRIATLIVLVAIVILMVPIYLTPFESNERRCWHLLKPSTRNLSTERRHGSVARA
ncbi:hypothetical protein ACYZTR_14140 [Pseudomonas sp. Hz4]